MLNLYKKVCLKLFLIVLLVGCSNDVNFSVPQMSQDFNQSLAYNNKVDFLFIVDNSQSMDNIRFKLHDSLAGLVDTLNQLKLDFRLASTSTTMANWYPMAGRLFGEPKYITPETPNFLARLQERILIGGPASSIEKGLDSMLNVLSEAYQNSEGQNFLRNDSLLVIVYVTNEDDGSDKINSSSKNDQTKYYSDFLNTLRPTWSNGERGWIFNFVGLTSNNDPCKTGDMTNTKIPGIRLMELANKSKGRIESICQVNLSFAVSNIKARIMQFLTDYKLNKIPDINTIKVFINGVEIPKSDTQGWSYIASTNVIRFNGNSVPKADAEIRIDFTPDAPN